jgi:FKBP-type peptidyl-prolyl cis-trans isomerase
LDWQKSSNEDENSTKTSNQTHLVDCFVDTANADEIVVSSGGVVKRVVQQGSGDVVPLHATCLVHYVGRVLSNGEIFMDTCRGDHASPVQMIAGRGRCLPAVFLFGHEGTTANVLAYLWIDTHVYFYSE